MRNSLATALHATFLGLGLGLASCSSGGSSAGPPPPPPSLPEVGFPDAELSLIEEATLLEILITLDKAAETTVDVPFQLGGSAVQGEHYEIDSSPLSIPAGDTSAVINIELRVALEVFAEDVTLQLSLGEPTGATLGGSVFFELQIENDDLFEETELNNDSYSANIVGDLLSIGMMANIQGSVLAEDPDLELDIIDVFRVTAESEGELAITLTPEQAGADISLWVVIPGNGAVLAIFDNAGAGEPEVLRYALAASESVCLLVRTEWEKADYTLELEMEPVLSPATSGSGSATFDRTHPLLRQGLDWPDLARALRERAAEQQGDAGLVFGYIYDESGFHPLGPGK